MDNKLNKSTVMKELIYKGFGFDGKEELTFKISIEQTLRDKVRVEIFSSLPLSPEKKKKILSEYDSLSPEDRKMLHLTGSISPAFMNVMVGNEDEIFSSFINENFYYHDVTWGDIKPGELPDNPCFAFVECEKLEVAIQVIKKIVSLYRDYWKTEKKHYNELANQLNDLGVEDFIEGEVVHTITFVESKTVTFG